MSDRDAFLTAIRAAPDDDTPRLVFADWLDDHDDPDRAAFIRAQVEAVRAEPCSPAARAAARAAADLLARHRPAWSRHLGGHVLGHEFSRGFVGHVTVDVARFPESAAAVFATDPVHAVELHRVQTPGEDWVSLVPAFDVPELRHVTRLDLPGLADRIEEDEWYALERSPHLVGLRELSVRGTPFPPTWLSDLLAGDALPNLTGLDASELSHAGPAVAAGLLRATHRRLTALDVTGVVFKPSGLVRDMLGAKCLERLEELRLGFHGGSLGLTGPLPKLNLGWVLPWASLRRLDLEGQGVGPGGVREIARTSDARHLRRLGLAHNGIAADGVRELLESPHLNLFHLDVRGNRLDAGEVAALRARFPEAVVTA